MSIQKAEKAQLNEPEQKFRLKDHTVEMLDDHTIRFTRKNTDGKQALDVHVYSSEEIAQFEAIKAKNKPSPVPIPPKRSNISALLKYLLAFFHI